MTYYTCPKCGRTSHNPYDAVHHYCGACHEFNDTMDAESQQRYLIWSEEHQAWWSPGRSGYTRSLTAAGRYSKEEAQNIVTGANKYLVPRRFNEVAIPDPLLP